MRNAKPTVRQIILLLQVLICTSTSYYAQNENLIPANDFRTNTAQLFSGLDTVPVVRYTVLPSFSQPYHFSIEMETETNYKIIANTECSGKINTLNRNIDKDLVLAVKNLFDKVITQIKQPQEI